MHIRYSMMAAALTALLVVGCATKPAVHESADPRIEELKREPGWAVVETAVRSEVKRKEGRDSPLASAYCFPVLHTNRTWAVVVSVAYPDYREADHVNLVVSDTGTIGAYGKMSARRDRSSAGAAQFVELRAKIETVRWHLKGLSGAAPAEVRCVVGTTVEELLNHR